MAPRTNAGILDEMDAEEDFNVFGKPLQKHLSQKGYAHRFVV